MHKCVHLVEDWPPGGSEVEEPPEEDEEAGEIYTAKMVVKVTGGWYVNISTCEK